MKHELVTVKEAAALARVSEDTVRRWVDKGAVRVLVSSPAARRLLVMRADVDPAYRTPKRRDGQ
jgi:excisionase family DNA binding protein